MREKKNQRQKAEKAARKRERRISAAPTDADIHRLASMHFVEVMEAFKTFKQFRKAYPDMSLQEVRDVWKTWESVNQ